jgi:hypothetical protein
MAPRCVIFFPDGSVGGIRLVGENKLRASFAQRANATNLPVSVITAKISAAASIRSMFLLAHRSVLSTMPRLRSARAACSLARMRAIVCVDLATTPKHFPLQSLARRASSTNQSKSMVSSSHVISRSTCRICSSRVRVNSAASNIASSLDRAVGVAYRYSSISVPTITHQQPSCGPTTSTCCHWSMRHFSSSIISNSSAKKCVPWVVGPVQESRATH